MAPPYTNPTEEESKARPTIELPILLSPSPPIVQPTQPIHQQPPVAIPQAQPVLKAPIVVVAAPVIAAKPAGPLIEETTVTKTVVKPKAAGPVIGGLGLDDQNSDDSDSG